MTAKLEDSKRILAETFRTARILLRLSVAEYAHLFEVSEDAIRQLETGEIPDNLDDKMFKLLLATVSLQINETILHDFLTVAQKKYPNLKLDSPSALLNKLFAPNLTGSLGQYPWISQTAKFRCRPLQLTDQANGILFWAEEPDTHRFLVATLPNSVIGHLNLVDNYTVILIPKFYLFLRLNTTKSQLPLLLSHRFAEKLPIGLSIPKQPFLTKSPTQTEANEAPRRLFIFSPDSNSISEMVF